MELIAFLFLMVYWTFNMEKNKELKKIRSSLEDIFMAIQFIGQDEELKDKYLRYTGDKE